MSGFRTPLAEFVFMRTYSRWRDDLGRRETYEEVVERVVSYLQRKRPGLPEKMWKAVRMNMMNFDVFPAMRLLWSAGEPMESNNLAGFNCSALEIREFRDFGEMLYLLMHGVGAGFSVEPIDCLPPIPVKNEISKKTVEYVVRDSKEGWRDSLDFLFKTLLEGDDVDFDYSLVRPKGARLKKFGGRASGPGPLHQLHQFVVETFHKAQGRQLTTAEVHDICCEIAQVVVVGGTRRCLPVDSMVYTKEGPKQIKDIKAGDFIITEGNEKEVKASESQGVQKTIIIKHDHGSLECTENHQVLVYINSENKEFKLAKDIKRGDLLVWDLEPVKGDDVVVLPIFETNCHFNAKKMVFPEVLNEDLSWFFGFVAGDGHVSPRGIEITETTSQPKTLLKAQRIAKEQFGIDAKISKEHGDCDRLRINSVALSKWMKDFIKNNGDSVRIPEFIKNASVGCRWAYLAGIFDADGRWRQDGVCERVTSISNLMIYDIELLLLSLGIASVKHSFVAKTAERRDYQALSIKGSTSRISFIDNIRRYSESDKIKENAKKGTSSDFKYRKTDFDAAIKGFSGVSHITYQTSLEKGLINKETTAPSLVKEILIGKETETWDIEVEGNQFTTSGVIVHNSSLVSLAALTDLAHANLKKGAFPLRRYMANNSAIYDEKPGMIQFMKEWIILAESGSGERGIFNRGSARKLSPKRRDSSLISLGNPCMEIMLRNQGLCNLSSIVVRENDTVATLTKKCETAAWLATIQASFTDFPSMSGGWKKNAEEEALIGVSLAGQMDNPQLLDTTTLKHLKDTVIRTNKKAAKALGINPAKATTCVKPEGTMSLVADCGAGLHPYWSPFYIRRVRISAVDPLCKVLQCYPDIPLVPEVGQTSENCSTWVVEFPCKAPATAKFKSDMTAIDQLKWYLHVMENYVEHNASMTCYVKDSEWLRVGDFVYENFDKIVAVSFLPDDGGVYALAPLEAITEEEYEKRISIFPKIDYSLLSLYEREDMTEGAKSYACVGGGCTL